MNLLFIMQPLPFKNLLFISSCGRTASKCIWLQKKIWNTLLLIIFLYASNTVGWNPPTPFHCITGTSNAESFKFFSPRMIHLSRLWEYKNNINPYCLKKEWSLYLSNNFISFSTGNKYPSFSMKYSVQCR